MDALVRATGPAVRYALVTTLSEATPEPGVEDGYAGTRDVLAAVRLRAGLGARRLVERGEPGGRDDPAAGGARSG